MAFALSATAAAAADAYDRHPTWSDLVLDYPSAYGDFASGMVGHSWPVYTAVAATTVALLPFDQKITDASQDFAIRNDIMDQGAQETILTRFSLFGREEAIHGPNSMTGVFWYFGDGLFTFSLATGFGLYGYTAGSYRATNVAFQIVQSIAIAGPTVLAIKMAVGREAPSRASKPGGKVRGFPGFANYAKDQARYYAYPSGHTTTAVSTLVVVAENFPEQEWIMPVGSTMVGLLMVSLMNVNSHWPSDFPLAVLLGYTSAHSAVARAQRKAETPAAALRRRRAVGRGLDWVGISPSWLQNDPALEATWSF